METDEQEIRNLIATWLSASKAGETETVLNLMTEDVVFLRPGQPPMRGKSEFAASQAALADTHLEASSEIQEIKVFGDWAYIWNKLTVVMTPKGGKSVKRAGDILSVLQKQNGRWVIFRDANMLAPVE